MARRRLACPGQGRGGGPARPDTPLAAGKGRRQVGQPPGIAAAIAHSGDIIDNSDPNDLGPGPHHGWTRLLLLLTLILVVTAFVILIRGVAASVEQRRLRRQLPPRPGPGGHALEAT